RNYHQPRFRNEVEIGFQPIAFIDNQFYVWRQLARARTGSVLGKQFTLLLQEHARTARASHCFHKGFDVAQGAAGAEHVIAVGWSLRPRYDFLPTVYFERNVDRTIRSDAVVALAAA